MAADPPKKTNVKKLLSGAGALVVLAVGALFTGIGEGAVNRLIDAMSPQESPTATAPTTMPSTAKEALTIAVSTDIGAAGDLFALRSKESEGPIAATLVSGKVGKNGDPWETFLEKHEGAPAGEVIITMVLTGHRDPGIRVTNIGVEKLDTQPLMTGTAIKLITQGEIESIKLTVNLDEPRPRILTGGKPYFPDTNIALKAGEQISLKFTVTASAKFYRWVFAIDYVDESGAPQQVFLNRVGQRLTQASAGPPGDAFTLTAKAPKYAAAWEENLGIPGFSPAKN